MRIRGSVIAELTEGGRHETSASKSLRDSILESAQAKMLDLARSAG